MSTTTDSSDAGQPLGRLPTGTGEDPFHRPDLATGDGDLGTRPRSHTARWVAGAVGVLVAGLVVLLAIGPGGDEETSELLGTRVPRVAGPTLDGGSYDIDNSRGRWVLVNFFATWCAPCISEHPELAAFDQWGSETGQAEVVAVVFNDPVENVTAFFDENGGTWPVLDQPSLPVRFQVAQVPESFLVSPTGQVVQHIKGEVRADELIGLIEETS